MADSPLNKEMILEAAIQIFRRFGPDKTTVVDIARSLDVSHATIYKHFPSKLAIQEAVAERWLGNISLPFDDILEQSDNALECLRLWFHTYMEIKRKKVLDDPEIFTMYTTLVERMVDLVSNHEKELTFQIEQIIKYGMETGEFKEGSASDFAGAIFTATTYFHHPSHASKWLSPDFYKKFEDVLNIILLGIIK